ncbi:hypothetical protein [Hugenholtzia roseola]|uniref:hypothetical protein n=1 Tax=Hugenholtzia roseola TaxID=1002 RepID=UPI0003FDE514|nr:hypothetical protein [Hugenholtzia roseola]
MQKRFFTLLFCLAILPLYKTFSQEAEKPKEDHSYKPLTMKLSEDGKKYVRFIIWNQVWARYTENNPGTLDVNGAEQANSFDVGMRRARVLAYAQISPRFMIMTHFGINNQTFVNGGIPAGGATGNSGAIGGQSDIAVSAKKPQLFLHDIWNEFKVVDKKLYIGSGLHYWNGISRMTNASTLNFMTIDAPIFNWPLIELTDQFARQFGFYAKGQLGKLDYRIAYNKPFSVGGRAEDVADNGIAVNVRNENWASQGYFNWQFFDMESNLLPYFVGTYLGSKKVFNIGAGFHYHPEATASKTAGVVTNHDMLLIGIDAFLDLPLNKEKGTALTAYSVFYNYDFGDNYLRNVGIMNIATGSDPAKATFAGAGNSQPLIGTGNISYTQLGYLLPTFKNGNKVQPFAAFTYKDFERLNDSSTQFDLGMNYFINSHHAKITIQYSTRPLYDTDRNRSGSAGELILQTHIFL